MKYKIILLAIIVLLVVVSMVVFLFGRKSTIGEKATLEFWGLDEPQTWSKIIAAYQAQNKKIIINYVQKNQASYEKELLNALASGTGPDIVIINNTWLQKHLAKLSPLPNEPMDIRTFKETYPDVIAADLVRQESAYGLPLYVDTLVLYYNKNMFNTAGLAEPPRTWDEFNEVVRTLVQKDSGENIIRAGAALGTASNVNYAADILSLLMLQTGTIMISSDGTKAAFAESVRLKGELYFPGRAAVDFYTSFSDALQPVYTWNARLPNSLDAFGQGQAAMYLGYAKDLKAIRNSKINFGVSPMPQIKDASKDPTYVNVNFANYQAAAVTLNSHHKNIAWNFLLFATSRNAAANYLFSTILPTARKDLIQFQSADPILAILAKQILSAFSWPQPDDVEVTKIFNKLIDSVALGQVTIENALRQAAIEVTNLIRK